jgi:hypothetical protein
MVAQRFSRAQAEPSSKSMRRTCTGEISAPHFGHTASSDARTFSRLIFRELAMI